MFRVLEPGASSEPLSPFSGHHVYLSASPCWTGNSRRTGPQPSAVISPTGASRARIPSPRAADGGLLGARPHLPLQPLPSAGVPAPAPPQTVGHCILTGAPVPGAKAGRLRRPEARAGRRAGRAGRAGWGRAGGAGLLGVGSPLLAAPVSLFSASEANGSVILEGPRLRGGGVLGRLITGCRAACSLAGNSQGFRHGPPSARPCWGSSCRLSAVATVDPGLSGQVSMRSYPKW